VQRAVDAAAHGHVSFGAAAQRFIDLHDNQWKNPKHRQQWKNTLDTYAAKLSDLPVDVIKTPHVVACLLPIWVSKPETARRVRGRIERVLSASIALGERSGPNPAGWKDNLEHVLPPQRTDVKHFSAVPFDAAPDAFKNLTERRGLGQGNNALLFTILTALRSGETRRVEWSDIDDNTLVIPGSRMKAGRVHRVPLNQPVQQLLSGLRRMAGTELVFPSTRGGPISNMTMAQEMKRSGLKEFTVHGWRSTFSDWANNAGFRRDFVEDALAHQIGNAVERSYRRGDYLEQRRELMDAWGEYLHDGG